MNCKSELEIYMLTKKYQSWSEIPDDIKKRIIATTWDVEKTQFTEMLKDEDSVIPALCEPINDDARELFINVMKKNSEWTMDDIQELTAKLFAVSLAYWNSQLAKKFNDERELFENEMHMIFKEEIKNEQTS